MNCGEYGCMRYCPDSCRYQWFQDITSVFKEYGISYTLWGFVDKGFGFWDHNNVFDNKMIESLRLKE